MVERVHERETLRRLKRARWDIRLLSKLDPHFYGRSHCTASDSRGTVSLLVLVATHDSNTMTDATQLMSPPLIGIVALSICYSSIGSLSCIAQQWQ